MLLAHHSLIFRFHTRALLTLAVALFLVTMARAEPAHRRLLVEATEAAKKDDLATAIEKLERAAKFAPDYPRLHWNLARYYAHQKRTDDALRSLRTLADMGLVCALEKEPAFESLRSTPEFAALVAAFAGNEKPAHSGANDETAWAITDVTGIIESVAIHPTSLESFFGDVRNRCIWYRDVSGPSATLRKFSLDADGLFGVFALRFSADGKTLWGTTSALPEMAAYTGADQGRAALVAYDYATRKLRRTWPLPADGAGHVLGDFALAADGTVYATDSVAPVIWRLPPGGEVLEKWVSYRWFVSLQGAALSADGRTLYVADYANGIWRIDTASKEASVLKAPAHSTLFGIDGLYAVPGGLLAVQNGLNPQRILRIDLAESGAPKSVRVLIQGHPKMSDIALGQVINGHFDFIGNSGWALDEDPKAAPAARAVIILRTALN